MKPLYERILIKPLDKETTTRTGIMLPDKAVKRPNIGTVVACGGGTTHNPMLVSPGDLVLHNRFAGVELMYGGARHYVIMSNEVIAILDSEDEVKFEDFE